ncbi:hypothetical protein KC330_g8255 [Hortaea werneckii]|nr:hypothetical protein KC330_g8255 [Hortaea werneckii]
MKPAIARSTVDPIAVTATTPPPPPPPTKTYKLAAVAALTALSQEAKKTKAAKRSTPERLQRRLGQRSAARRRLTGSDKKKSTPATTSTTIRRLEAQEARGQVRGDRQQVDAKNNDTGDKKGRKRGEPLDEQTVQGRPSKQRRDISVRIVDNTVDMGQHNVPKTDEANQILDSSAELLEMIDLQMEVWSTCKAEFAPFQKPLEKAKIPDDSLDATDVRSYMIAQVSQYKVSDLKVFVDEILCYVLKTNDMS